MTWSTVLALAATVLGAVWLVISASVRPATAERLAPHFATAMAIQLLIAVILTTLN